MKGKWARGIAPRFFAWVIKDQLAVSERPGGYSRNHRPVRRQEEILWLRGEGFTRVVSLLQSPHNLHAYDKLELTWAHIPFGSHDDPHVVLPNLYSQLRSWMASGERLLLHQEELGDRLMGVVAGYLRWSGLVPAGPQAISVVERILHRQMGPEGRMLVALAPDLAGAACRNGADGSHQPQRFGRPDQPEWPEQLNRLDQVDQPPHQVHQPQQLHQPYQPPQLRQRDEREQFEEPARAPATPILEVVATTEDTAEPVSRADSERKPS